MKTSKQDPRTAEKIEILKQARKLIASDQESYICYAIATASTNAKLSNEMSDAVLKALSPRIFYDWWLLERRPELDSVPREEFEAACRAGRLAWIDDMIKNLGGAP